MVMADKTAKREMFIGKRVQALAVMYLTRRSDLIVELIGAPVSVSRHWPIAS